MFASAIVKDPHFTLSEPVPISDQGAHEPDVCLDQEQNPWVVWSQRGRTGDRILAKRLAPDTSEITLSTMTGVECQPAIICDSNGLIRCFWVAQRDNAWHLITRAIRDETALEEEVLASSPEGLFRPRAVTAGAELWLVYETVDRKQSRISCLRLQNGAWTPPVAVSSQTENAFRPAMAPRRGMAPCVTWDSYREGRYHISYVQLNQMDNPIGVTHDLNRNVQSDVECDQDGGSWIAWAGTEGNRARDPWWLTKYAELRLLRQDEVFVPTSAMPGRDLHNEDTFQGWEFPELVLDAYGRVWIFGQASHALYAQYFSREGWSERFTISEKRWGSWKPRFRTAGSDPIYVVSMGLRGAQVQRLDVAPPPDTGQREWPLAPQPAGRHARTLEPAVRRSVFNGERPTASGLNLYFGDLHAHSIYGDATGDVDEFYFRYRDAYGYDFAALTEHDFLDGMELSRSELAMMWASADRMTRDGEFVAFYGYEWTSPALADHAGPDRVVGEGHRHVLYPDKSGPLVSYGDPTSNTGKKLLASLRGRRALVIPHHTAWSGTDLDAYDPELSRLIEICSTHGRFEHPGNLPIGYRRDHVHAGKYVVDALAHGHRVGFVGGSDSHGLRWHATEMEGRAAHIPPGTRVGWKEDAYRTGMTVILAPELTRSALFEGLYNRRCYATSGVPIVLDFTIDGHIMGSEIELSGAPTIRFKVCADSPIRNVDVVRQGFTFESFAFSEGERRLSFEGELRDALLIPGEIQYYYLRVVQYDGNMAWSSPIWVTFK